MLAGSRRRPARVRVVILAILAAAGWETARMTLAQELAWDRWKMCDNISGVTLKEARPDGQIWVYYSPQVTHLVREEAVVTGGKGCASCSATGFARPTRRRP